MGIATRPLFFHVPLLHPPSQSLLPPPTSIPIRLCLCHHFIPLTRERHGCLMAPEGSAWWQHAVVETGLLLSEAARVCRGRLWTGGARAGVLPVQTCPYSCCPRAACTCFLQDCYHHVLPPPSALWSHEVSTLSPSESDEVTAVLAQLRALPGRNGSGWGKK